MHKNYIRYGSHTEVKLDSVVINMNALPIEGTFYALQEVHIGKDVRSLPIAASFQIVQGYRHANNSTGHNSPTLTLSATNEPSQKTNYETPAPCSTPLRFSVRYCSAERG